jgi:hypothetical protein
MLARVATFEVLLRNKGIEECSRCRATPVRFERQYRQVGPILYIIRRLWLEEGDLVECKRK